jgi:hypothetical protein
MTIPANPVAALREEIRRAGRATRRARSAVAWALALPLLVQLAVYSATTLPQCAPTDAPDPVKPLPATWQFVEYSLCIILAVGAFACVVGASDRARRARSIRPRLANLDRDQRRQLLESIVE